MRDVLYIESETYIDCLIMEWWKPVMLSYFMQLLTKPFDYCFGITVGHYDDPVDLITSSSEELL